MISFVVPAYNEELELPATLAALRFAAEKAGQEHEIIVVDDASTDATAELARKSGARIISIDRRHIAAARNAGAREARGQVLFFVDADTRINAEHITGALTALRDGYVGGGARVTMDGEIPRWSRISIRLFTAIYFGVNLAAGAFLFTSRQNFEAAGGFDEQFFVGEEVYFSFALRRLGRFKILREPIVTSGRKLRMHSAGYILWKTLGIVFGGPNVARSRRKLDLWYDGKREGKST
jgi:glycosyltransferase involved in cell wall biosynthesis